MLNLIAPREHFNNFVDPYVRCHSDRHQHPWPFDMIPCIGKQYRVTACIKEHCTNKGRPKDAIIHPRKLQSVKKKKKVENRQQLKTKTQRQPPKAKGEEK
jgi:hypothetical protein